MLVSSASMLLHDFSPQHAQNLFGHHMMGSSGLPSEQSDKNGVIGLNLVPSDFSQGPNCIPVQTPNTQLKQFFLANQQPSPVKASDERASSPVGGGEPSADAASTGPVADVKAGVASGATPETKPGEQAGVQAGKANAAEVTVTVDTASPSKGSPAGNPSGIKVEATVATDTPTESRRSSEAEKRPHPDSAIDGSAASSAASTSPQKRQRVIV